MTDIVERLRAGGGMMGKTVLDDLDELLAENVGLKTEIERLLAEREEYDGADSRNEIKRLLDFAQWVEDHSNDPQVVQRARAELRGDKP